MNTSLSREIFGELLVDPAAGERLKPGIAEALGIMLVAELKRRRLRYHHVVGIGQAGSDLAAATVDPTAKYRRPVAFHSLKNNGLRIDPPIHGGNTLLITDVIPKDHHLARITNAIRQERGTVSDMVVLADESGSLAAARTLGISVIAPFQVSESGLIVPSS